jgi:hypothetical protein
LRPPRVPGAPVAAPPLLELGVDGAIGEEDVVEEARERTREAELEHGVDGWGGEQRAHEYKGIDCHGGSGWVDQDLGWGNRWWRLDGSREEAQWKLNGSSMPWPRERHERERDRELRSLMPPSRERGSAQERMGHARGGSISGSRGSRGAEWVPHIGPELLMVLDCYISV